MVVLLQLIDPCGVVAEVHGVVDGVLSAFMVIVERLVLSLFRQFVEGSPDGFHLLLEARLLCPKQAVQDTRLFLSLSGIPQIGSEPKPDGIVQLRRVAPLLHAASLCDHWRFAEPRELFEEFAHFGVY